jgi:hypothetical protein
MEIDKTEKKNVRRILDKKEVMRLLRKGVIILD